MKLPPPTTGHENRYKRLAALGLLLLGLALYGGPRLTFAQSSQWDALLSNTNWYVPAPYLVAYAAANSNSFTIPPPILAGDQTLWTLGPVVNGSFSGTSSATLFVSSGADPGQPSASSTSTSTMSGTIAANGNIRITFTDTTSGVTTLGVGTMQSLGEIPLMEMQMITGTGLLLTHWAYMTPYDPATFTPPQASEVSTAYGTSPEWAWTANTAWAITSPSLFGSDEPGRFTITQYSNGFFLGEGHGPTGSAVQFFTQLGSITPEGSVLFDTISNGALTSLLGQISGDVSDAAMTLSGYGFSGDDYSKTASLKLIGKYCPAGACLQGPLLLLLGTTQ